MSCELHEIGSLIQLRISLRVDVPGNVFNLPAGAVGTVKAVNRDSHMLHVYFPQLDVVVGIPASAASSMTPGPTPTQFPTIGG